ncbi:MAG: hypothetical protein ACRDPO_37285 [Streptosporangiaceae bacterium]
MDEVGIIAEQANNGRQLDNLRASPDYYGNPGIPILGHLGSLTAGQGRSSATATQREYLRTGYRAGLAP